MALSWNEIKNRALKFTKEWEGESRERAEKDSFWNDFFNVFGISRRRLATFEEPVKKLSGNQGFIDLFWKGTLLVEHKSKGKNLDSAFEQATDYFHGIKEHDLPKYVLVSDSPIFFYVRGNCSGRIQIFAESLILRSCFNNKRHNSKSLCLVEINSMSPVLIMHNIK